VKHFSKIVAATAAALAIAAFAAPAGATTLLTFAQDSQLNPGASTFKVTNTGASGTLNTISGSGVAQLVFTSSSPLSLPPPLQIANFTFSGQSTHAATGAGLTTQQLFDSGTLAFTNLLGNLLTVNFTDGLLGYKGGSLFLWMGDDPTNSDIPATSTITYTSDFDTPDLNSFGAAYGMVALTSTNIVSIGSNGGVGTFSASQVGTFSVGLVPEPATWGLMIVGFGGLGVMLRRKRQAIAFA
jgi:hypothetical protein